MESPSSLMGKFHRKKASRVPKLPGLSLGTREWSCPGMVNETSVGVSRGYTDYHQGRAIHMADSRID